MSSKLPLAGIRVLELGAYISGPYAGAMLSALGADVVKVEPPRGGDAFRRGQGTGSPYFVQYNAGKRSIAVDLKKAAGIDLIKRLLPKFDVFIENSRPGKTASLGLGPEVCKEINPRLVYSSVSGFGEGGELRDRAAYDSIGQSMGGFYSIMNDPGVPRLTGTCVADLITAIISLTSILAALVGRERDGGAGTVVSTSLIEAMSSISIDAMTQMFETGESPTRQTRHPQAQNFCLLTASGDPVTLHLSSSEKFWRALAKAMDREDLASDPRFTRYADRQDNFWELKPIIEAEFLKRTRAEWEERLTSDDVPFAPVLSMREIADHPQTKWLQLIEPDSGPHPLVRPAWRIDGERPHRSSSIPDIGEHSIEIASEVCGPREIETLLEEGAIFQPKPGQGSDDRADLRPPVLERDLPTRLN